MYKLHKKIEVDTKQYILKSRKLHQKDMYFEEIYERGNFS